MAARDMLRGVVAVSAILLTATATAAAATPDPVHGRTDSFPELRRQRSGLTVELIEQDLTFQPGDTVRLSYRITGDLDVGGVTPPTTTTTTTTPTTTTTVPTTEPAGDDAATAPPADETAPATTAAPETTTTTTTVPPESTLVVDVANFAPITDSDRASFDRIFGQQADPGAFRDNIDGVRFDNVRDTIEFISATEAVLTLDIPTDLGGDENLSGPDSLEFPSPGFTPLRMQLLVDDVLVATHGTVVERRPGDDEIQRPAEPVTLSLVAQVNRSTGTTSSTSATRNELADLIDTAAELTPPILAAVPPGAVADLRDPADAAAALDNDEVATRTDVELDVSSAVAAGVTDAFTRALNAGEDIVTDALRQTPTRVVWVTSKPISASGAQLLRDLGVRYIVMTPELYSRTIADDVPNTDRLVELALPDGGAMPVLLIDALGAALTTDVADEVLARQTSVEWAVRTSTELILDHRQNGRTVRRTRLLAGPDITPLDPRLVNALADVAELTPDLRFAAPSTLIGATDVQRPVSSGSTFPDAAGPDLVARLERINLSKLSLDSVGSMLNGDGARTAEWIAELDQLVSTSIDDRSADAVIDGVLDEAARFRTAIALPEPFTFTLTGNTDEITIRLGNRSDEPLNVILSLSSPKLDFPDNDQLITLRPNDSTDVQVPVRARSNGTSAVNVSVLTPLGEPLGEPVVLTSRVNALTGLGQVLTGAFVVMLGSWWFANWRKRRNAESTESTVDADTGAYAHSDEADLTAGTDDGTSLSSS